MKRKEHFKILFFGGNQLGCRCLRELVRWRNVEIIAVVARYDDYGSVVDPKAWNASLIRVAAEKRLTFFQPKYIDDPDFQKELNQLPRPDLILCVQFDKNLDPHLIHWPQQGSINFHFTILPHNHDHFPIPWTLIDEKPPAVTMHWLDGEMGMIESRRVENRSDDTALSLYHKITEEGFKLFKQNFPLVLEGKAPRKVQTIGGDPQHADGDLYDRNINWTWSAAKIDRMVRALTFPPFPAARTFIRDMEIELLNPVQIIPTDTNGSRPGQIVDIRSDGLVVQTQHGCIRVSKIRLNESLIMNSIKFCQQYHVGIGDSFQHKSA